MNTVIIYWWGFQSGFTVFRGYRIVILEVDGALLVFFSLSECASGAVRCSRFGLLLGQKKCVRE